MSSSASTSPTRRRPTTSPRGDSDDEESDNNDDDEDDEPDTTLTVPPGFKPLAKPEALPTCIDGLFAMMVLFDDMVWQFARVTEL
jgi:hypothetical protein